MHIFYLNNKVLRFLLKWNQVEVRVIFQLLAYAIAHGIYAVYFYVEQSAYVGGTHSYKKTQQILHVGYGGLIIIQAQNFEYTAIVGNACQFATIYTFRIIVNR